MNGNDNDLTAEERDALAALLVRAKAFWQTPSGSPAEEALARTLVDSFVEFVKSVDR
jgi:hypothetical protein